MSNLRNFITFFRQKIKHFGGTSRRIFWYSIAQYPGVYGISFLLFFQSYFNISIFFIYTVKSHFLDPLLTVFSVKSGEKVDRVV